MTLIFFKTTLKIMFNLDDLNPIILKILKINKLDNYLKNINRKIDNYNKNCINNLELFLYIKLQKHTSLLKNYNK
jgi:hypothetical protein